VKGRKKHLGLCDSVHRMVEGHSWSFVNSTTTAEVVFRVSVLQCRSCCIRYVTKLYSSGLPACTLHVPSCLFVQLATKMSECIVGEDKLSHAVF
jgi:hypothetical protein